MVLQAERYPGGYQQNNYSAHQGPDGYYNSYQGMTAAHTTPYSGYPQVSTYPSSHASQYQSSWSHGEEYHGNGPSHPAKPSTGGYGNSHGYDNSFNHGSMQAHGSPHGHGHGSPDGHGKPHGYGNSHGYGGGAMNHFGKPTHGHGYGAPAGPNYAHAPSGHGMNLGYQKPSWTLKGLEDDDE